MKPKKTWIQHQTQKTSEQRAGALACELLESTGMLSVPVDPFALAALEAPRLKLIGANLKSRCDGQLEYHREKDLFLLFYNNRYNLSAPNGGHHPRTRFSVAHELGHFYIEHHRTHLLHGGRAHPSSGEFSTDILIEREADAFAAGLLMPSPLLRPIANKAELDLDRIETIAGQFKTSLVSTAIRCVQHSDFPCEVLGIREGRVAWRFRPTGPRDPLKEGKCYAQGNGPLQSKTAQEQWAAFESGVAQKACLAGRPQDWFRQYGPATKTFTVWEHFLPVPSMATLVVLLTVSENDLFDGVEDDDD